MPSEKTDAELMELFSRLPDMMDFRRGVGVCAYLLRSEHLPGDVVEFGCHLGHTAALMAALTRKNVWLYDSFQGLPDKSPQDVCREDFEPGYLAVSEESVVTYFAAHDLPMPRIIGKWFKDVRPEEMPDEIAFAHIDGDFYDSIMDSLKLVYPRLVPGGICLVDDFGAEILQGVRPAVEDYFRMIGESEQPGSAFVTTPAQLCIIR